jgi:DNA-binding MarR family transcriptional regulator
MGVKARTKQATAAEVWRLLLRCAMTQFGRSSQIVQRLGLTPGHMKALLMLDVDHPVPMGSLAQLVSCDASTVTWLVDRLEERGLVERRGMPSDRRVKTVALTALGIETKETLEKELYQPPEGLLELSGPALDELRRALSEMVEAGGRA